MTAEFKISILDLLSLQKQHQQETFTHESISNVGVTSNHYYVDRYHLFLHHLTQKLHTLWSAAVNGTVHVT